MQACKPASQIRRSSKPGARNVVEKGVQYYEEI